MQVSLAVSTPSPDIPSFVNSVNKPYRQVRNVLLQIYRFLILKKRYNQSKSSNNLILL